MDNDGFTQQVRDAIDIVDVVSEQTRLERRGKRLLGLCPFHKEKTPSFSVDATQGLYYCFGCGAGGDALGFHMQITGDDFPMALRSMARRYGIAIPSRGERPTGPNLDGVLEAAAEFFTEQLRRSRFATGYLEQRKIDPELSTAYAVGFAPDGWQNLLEALGKSFPREQLEAAGLVARSDSGRVYDRFRNRLMFPIRATSGRLVGFGGRALGDDKAKYINTAETEAFRKGKILYGLDTARAKMRDAGKALLVEGYFDVLGAVASGIEWTVASMGTAFTEQQAKLLHRYADEVIIGYDGDRAGEEASRKALVTLLATGASVRRARFPAGQDPDSLRLDEGPETVRALIEEAEDAVLLEIERVPPEASRDPRRAAVAAEPVAALLQQVPDDLMRREYAKRAAGRLGVSDDLLLRAPQVSRYQRRGAAGHASSEAEADPTAATRARPRESMEHQALRLMLAGARPESPPPPAVFWEEDCRSLYSAWVRAVLDEEFDGDLQRAVRAQDEGRGLELLARLSLSLELPSEADGEDRQDPDRNADAPDDERVDSGAPELDADELEKLDGLLASIELRHVRQENLRLKAAMDEAQREGDTERLLTLAEEKQELTRRVHLAGIVAER